LVQQEGGVRVAPVDTRAHAFAGALDEGVRAAEYNGTATTQRCGFQAPSGFDVIAAAAAFKRCKVVVANVVARGRDVLLNAAAVAEHNRRDPRLCFVSAMDITGAIHHHRSPAMTSWKQRVHHVITMAPHYEHRWGALSSPVHSTRLRP
jgi:hypothetical protein